MRFQRFLFVSELLIFYGHAEEYSIMQKKFNGFSALTDLGFKSQA